MKRNKTYGRIPKWIVFLALVLAAAPLSPSIRGLELPPLVRHGFDNGMRVLYVNDDLPQTTLIAMVGYGRLHENRETAGLSSLLAETLDLAGSKKYPGKALREAVESMGGRLSIESSWESTVISVKVLSRFTGRALDILSDLVSDPNLNRGDLETARSIQIDGLRRKYDDPATIAFEKARETLFNGKGYGSLPTVRGMSSYRLEDLERVWREYFTAGNIILGINSSQGPEEMMTAAASSFSRVRKGVRMDYAADEEEIRRSLEKARGVIYLYPRDIPQATIVMATGAPSINDEGTYSLSLMNYILGEGSFNSRLMSEIRVKRGLAYAVQSVMRFRYATGVFMAFAQTENSSVAEVLGLMEENIGAMMKDPVPERDLDWAKKAVRNSYIFNFDTTMNVLGNYLDAEYNRLPDDYFTAYLDRIEAVSQDDILRRSGRVFSGGFVRVVVGSEELVKPLSSVGTVVLLPKEE